MAYGTTSSRMLEVEGVPILVTHKRVRNVNFRIHEDGSVAMSVPRSVSYATAERLARERMDWIRDKRASMLARAVTDRHRWLDGETLSVWGNAIPIEVRVGPGTEEARLVGDSLVLSVATGHDGTDAESVRRRARLVERLLADQTTDAIGRLLPGCVARVGRAPASVTVRRMKTRWGSCTVSRGTIRINTALAEHPEPCLEMVLTHELCHLVVPNHGPRFHELMDACCPSWRELQHHLDENPPRMYPEDQR